MEAACEGIETRISKYEGIIKEFQEKIKEREGISKAAETAISKYKAQIENVRNNREYDALNKEIEYQTLEIQLSEKRINDYNESIRTKKEEIARIEEELANLFKYRMENPYMFTGQVECVRIRVDADQFTQIVDWFSDDFRVVGYDADEDSYYDIEVKVNLNSFTFWVLQYSGCVEVLSRRGDDSFRRHIKETLEKALEKYEED